MRSHLWHALMLGAASSLCALKPRRAPRALAPRRGGASDDDAFDAFNEEDYAKFTQEMNANDDEEGPLDLRDLENLNADMSMDELMAKLGGGTKFDSDAAGEFGGVSPYDEYGADEFATGRTAMRTEGAGKTYVWQQTGDTMTVALPVAEGVRAKEVKVDYPSRDSIRVEVAGALRLEEKLRGNVQTDESFWSLDEDANGNPSLVLDIQKASGSKDMWAGFSTAEGDASLATVTERVYLDVDVAGETSRVEVGLFGEDVPRTAENFRKLCEGVEVDGETRSYAGSPFHRVIPGFMAQGGDVTNGDGTGGVSGVEAGGGAFADEAFPFWHAAEGLVSMANSGPDSNKSQFFITLGACTWLDGKHVVFGRVLEGLDTIKKVEGLGSPSGAVSSEARVVGCGVVPP